MENQDNQMIFEIVKILLICGVFAATVFFAFRKYMESKIKILALKRQDSYSKEGTPMKLLAYERLTMFCERISIPNLIMRLGRNNMRSEELLNAMMIAINQEFDHNLTQQIYVSENLWKIITLAKDETLQLISEMSDKADPNQDYKLTGNQIIAYRSKWPKNPLETAKEAIRNEARLIIP